MYLSTQLGHMMNSDEVITSHYFVFVTLWALSKVMRSGHHTCRA